MGASQQRMWNGSSENFTQVSPGVYRMNNGSLYYANKVVDRTANLLNNFGGDVNPAWIQALNAPKKPRVPLPRRDTTAEQAALAKRVVDEDPDSALHTVYRQTVARPTRNTNEIRKILDARGLQADDTDGITSYVRTQRQQRDNTAALSALATIVGNVSPDDAGIHGYDAGVPVSQSAAIKNDIRRTQLLALTQW